MAAANMRIVIGKLCRPAEEGSKASGFQKQYEVSKYNKVFNILCSKNLLEKSEGEDMKR